MSVAEFLNKRGNNMSLREMRIDYETMKPYEYDRVQSAVRLYQNYAGYALSMSEKGFYIADYGGKDSAVIKKLAELSGVKYHIQH